MNRPAYPKYKPSGVDWLGEVPEHWEITECKFGYEIQLGKMLQPEPGTPDDVEVPYFKSQHVQWERVVVEELPTMWASPNDLKKYSLSEGDLLVCEGGDVGRAAVLHSSPPNAIIQNALHRVRAKRGGSTAYLLYVLHVATAQHWFDILCNRSTIAHFTGEKFGALKISLPAASEQRAIADFLDRETSRLDTLVGKKRELIARLKERRAALITRAVTRGLDPAAKLKDSGVAWLGLVPQGWEVPQLRRVAVRIQAGCTPPTSEEQYYEDGELAWFGPSSFGDGLRLSNPVKLLNVTAAMDGVARLFPANATMVVTIGATIGKVGVLGEAASCNQQITAVVFDHRLVVPLFGTYQLKRLEQIFRAVAPSATLPIVSQGGLGSTHIALPPLPEQRAIADYLDRETGKLDRLTASVEAAIERLQEYRATLITAAVTGKIDVRKGTA